MQILNLPDYSSVLRINKAENTIFDIVRKKYVKLTPEEWVRQNFVLFMINERNFPSGLLNIEMGLTVNNLTRRCDIVGFNKNGVPKVIVECKAPSVKITQKTFDQIATYNLNLKVDYLIVTNGLSHYCCKLNHNENNYVFIEDIPAFNQISL
jgi:hypothetical protein